MKKKNNRLTVVFALILSVIVVVGVYFVVFSPIFTNKKSLISFRKDIYEIVLDPFFLPGILPYQAYVREIVQNEEGKDVYEYAMLGRVEKIDVERDLLVLKDLWGKRWFFNFGSQVYPAKEGSNYRNLMVSEVFMGEGEPPLSPIKYHLYNLDKPEDEGSYLKKGDILSVIWRDERKISDIRGMVTLMVVPKGENGVIPINKFVGDAR